MIAKLLDWLDAVLCSHVGDLRQIRDITTLNGLRAVKYQCVHCKAEFWEYIDWPEVDL